MAENIVEEWRAVVGFEGRYEVSNMGRVRSLDRWVARRGQCDQFWAGRTLKPCRIGAGYHRVCLCRKSFSDYVHAIVMRAFVGPRPEKYHVNHINGIKTDNRLVNLEYTTCSANMIHARDRFGAYCGERNGMARLTTEQMREIRRRFDQMVEEFEVSIATIIAIGHRRRWTLVE